MRSSRGAARAAIVCGVLAVLAVPGAVGAAQVSTVKLLDALYVGVPVSAVSGFLAVLQARRARFALALSLHPERRGLVRSARIVAWLGLYVGVTSALALGVYGVLRAAS